jgi:hypothetical protein
MNFELWQDQDDFFECLVVPSRKLQTVPTPSIPKTSPPSPNESKGHVH